MTYSSQLSNFGRADRKAFYLLFAPPEGPRHRPSLIPGGDRESSRGQRPRKTHPPSRSDPERVESGWRHAGLASRGSGNAPPPGSGNERGAFRGHCPRLLSCALAGHEKTTLRSYPAAPVSDVTDSHFRLCMLRMTDDFNLRMQDKLADARRRSNFRFPQTSYSCGAIWIIWSKEGTS